MREKKDKMKNKEPELDIEKELEEFNLRNGWNLK